MLHRARRAFIHASYGLIPAREPGQGLTEYGLILALVVVVVIVAISAFGSGTGRLINKTNAGLS
jgi:Flp pilus assembly pilin Flp